MRSVFSYRVLWNHCRIWVWLSYGARDKLLTLGLFGNSGLRVWGAQGPGSPGGGGSS